MAITHKAILGRETIYLIDPRQIKIVEGWNPRQRFGGQEDSELKESIRENGVLSPIRLKKINNELFLINGERRLRACLELISEGCNIKAPAIIGRKGISEVEAMYLAVTENTGKPFNPVEEATAYGRLISWGEPVKDIARKFGKSVQHIRNRLVLVDASAEVKESIINKEIQIKDAENIVKDSNGQIDSQREGKRQARKSRAPFILTISPVA